MIINGHWCWTRTAYERQADATVDRSERKATRQLRRDAVLALRNVNGSAPVRTLAAELGPHVDGKLLDQAVAASVATEFEHGA